MTDTPPSHFLTPDTTGDGSTNSIKKSRRQTAFYPNINSSNKPVKPFSRSAAKRESVMALGSIEHLQHYFTKTGLTAKHNPLVDKYNLKPAIGGLKLRLTSPTAEDTVLELPPSPDIPEKHLPAPKPHVRNAETDPETLLPGMVDDLINVSRAWRIDTGSEEDKPVDILATLKTTTRAIRSVRNYVLSLPDESTGSIRAQFRPKSLSTQSYIANREREASNTTPDPLSLIRKAALEVLSTLRELEEQSRLPLSDDAYDAQSDSGGSSSAHAAREGARVSSPSNLSDDLGSSSSPGSSHQPLDPAHDYSYIDPDSSITFIHFPGNLKPVPVWEDDSDAIPAFDEEDMKKERWDERLVLQSGWLYKQDVGIDKLHHEREVVGRYLDVVDEVLFRHPPGGERGWEKEKKRLEALASAASAADTKNKRRRTSAGDIELALGVPSLPLDVSRRRVTLGGGPISMLESLTLSDEPLGLTSPIPEEFSPSQLSPALEEAEEENIDESTLPNWARTNAYHSPLDRTYALLVSLLPQDLLPSLVPPSTTVVDFLSSLSSGQLLCIAYNTAVRRSRKPWGFVAKDGIHDIISLERNATAANADGKKAGGGWTFRRTDNLRLFVGALKLRYGIGVIVPPRSAVLKPTAPTGIPGVTSSSTATTPVGSPTSTVAAAPTSATGGVTPGQMIFDPKVVASKVEGWEKMLEGLVVMWMEAVVSERRVER